MSEPIKIPAYIDQPPHVMFWRLDEVMPIGIGLVAGSRIACDQRDRVNTRGRIDMAR